MENFHALYDIYDNDAFLNCECSINQNAILKITRCALINFFDLALPTAFLTQ